MTEEEIRLALGISPEAEVQCKPASRGCQTAQVQLGIQRAMEVLKEGKTKIGWSVCRVVSLERKNTQSKCFKCLLRGHMAAKCPNESIGPGCYRCGQEGHVIRDCRQQPKCPVCSRVDGHDTGHILGSQGCFDAVSHPTRRTQPSGRKGPTASQ